MKGPASALPAWEDKAAVARWAIATWTSVSAQAARTSELERLERLTRSPEQNTPYRPEEDPVHWPQVAKEGLVRWRKRAFELARQGRFDLLAQYVAVARLGDITLEERKVLTDILTAKIKRSKGRPRELVPHNPPHASTVNRLVISAEEIRALLIQHYGRRVMHLTTRAIDIAGEDAQWYGEDPAEMRTKVFKVLEATAPK